MCVGGGVALIRAQKLQVNLQGASEHYTASEATLRRSIQEPLWQIVGNAGEDAAVMQNRKESGKGAYG